MAAAALLRRGVCRTASAAARTPAAARAPASQARWARPLATTPATLSPGEDLGSFDYGFSKDRIEKGNVSGAAENRGFTYLLMGANKFIYASAVRIGALKFIATMSATKDVLALASAEFDVSAVEEGQTITVKWRGKPVFIRHRTPDEIASSEAVSLDELRDPETDAQRVESSEWLVVMGICTHLGCVPIANAGDYGGWFCPCHGSHYDVSGRIRKGPAPLNLEIPPYKFTGDANLLVG
jgi:ubiquinol-cytochrome c reductase iron-sulfur subunit